MIRLEAILLCDLIVRGTDGKPQVQGIFDAIGALSFPAQHSKMWLYFRFFVEGETNGGRRRALSLKVLRPNGVTETMNLPEAEAGPDGKVEGNVEIRQFPLFSSGVHWLELFFGEDRVGKYRFAVNQIENRQRDKQSGEQHDTIH